MMSLLIPKTKVIIATRNRKIIVVDQNATTPEDIAVESHIYSTLMILTRTDMLHQCITPLMISMTFLLATILDERKNMIGMHSHTSMKSSLIIFLILMTLIQSRHLLIQFTTLSIMVLFISQDTPHVVTEEPEDIVQQLDIEPIHRLTDHTQFTTVDQQEMMIRIVRVSTASLTMRWIWLSNVQNSLSIHQQVVKNHSLYGEEADRRRDAVIANNVRPNGSLSVHPAL